MAINIPQDNKLKQAYDFLSSVNLRAYKDTFLLSNHILSKNPLTSNFVGRYFKDELPRPPTKFCIFIKLFKYYLYSFKNLFSYLVEFILFRFSGPRFAYAPTQNQIVIIAPFFILRKIREENNYTDPYFPGMDDLLEKFNRHYAYLPFFDGPRKCYEFNSIASILRKTKKPILYEFQLLGLKDLLGLLYFILTYPLHLRNFIIGLESNSYDLRLLKSELLNSLDQVIFHGFLRYLLGKRIAALPYKKIKVISWYENQVYDKNFYKGLKSKGNKVDIYGAQLLLYSGNILNIIPDENEIQSGIVPDKILVNGSIFIPKNTRLNYHVGPSFRYSRLFKCSPKKEDQTNILVLLPYFLEDVENILKILSGAELIVDRVCIKAHPAIDVERFKHLFPYGATITRGDTYKLFETTKILIGAASGTLIEAASLGIPVISIKNNARFDFNPLPEYGKGIIWQEVASSEELRNQIKSFESILRSDGNEINKISDSYRKLFFCEPTEEKILESFDL
jgi:hypothetical protein